MLQKVIIKQDMHGPTAYPITDEELNKMLKEGTAEQKSPDNSYVFMEVDPPAKEEDIDSLFEDKDPQTYNTRDMVSEPNKRRQKPRQSSQRNRQIKAED